ncbi:protein phosphatase inhibitor 2-like isoform X2 [Hemitrygon akajei]|uniref:protein phosphatase inhibitor 2-like isoform X2 n=2 Tax=Hemitrygon akajei TaxID=2704970 RepID=UPI003BF9FCAD
MQSQPSSSQAMDKPVKGILKRSRRRTEEESQKKSQKWDEMNIIATYKPAEKDYGLMTIDEVKTPFRYSIDDEAGSSSGPAFSVDELRTRMNSLTTNKGKHQQVKTKNVDSDKDDLQLVDRESKRQFEQRRKQIYDEGRHIKRARELIAREHLDDNDDSDSDPDENYHYREMDEHHTLPGRPSILRLCPLVLDIRLGGVGVQVGR